MAKTTKERIEELMRGIGCTQQTDLLRKIYKYIYKTNEGAYQWADSNKSNFKKKLDGKRNFGLDEIAAIESLLNTDAQYLYDGTKTNNNFKPRGLEYAAYCDTVQAYDDIERASDDNHDVISSYDEYCNSIVDYIIKYEAINGIKYLYEKYGFKYNSLTNSFMASNNIKVFYAENKETPMLLAQIIAKKGDVELFYKVFDGFDAFMQAHHTDDNIYLDTEFADLVLRDEYLLNNIFKEQEFSYYDLYHNSRTFSFEKNTIIHPALNSILIYALCRKNEGKHVYIEQIRRILDFGIKHNDAQIDLLSDNITDFRYGLLLSPEGFIETQGLLVGNMVHIYRDQYMNQNIDEGLPLDVKNKLHELFKYEQQIQDIPQLASMKKKKFGNSYDDAVKYILRNSSICNQERYDSIVMVEIKKAIEQCDDSVKNNFASKMREVIEKSISELDNTSPGFTKQYLNLVIAKTFVDLHEKELNSI